MTRLRSSAVALATVLVASLAIVCAPASAYYADEGYECSVKPYEWCYDSGSGHHGYHNWEKGQSENKYSTNWLYVGVVSGNGSGYSQYDRSASEVGAGGKLSGVWSNKEYPYIGIITIGPRGIFVWGYFWDA
jgi:hypothetical protein